MKFVTGLSNSAVILIAYVTLPCLTSAFPQTTNAVHTRIKRGSFFSDVKHLGKTVFDNAKDKYEDKKLMPIDYVNAEKFCRSLGVADRRRNMHCVQDLTHNFVMGSVLSLFRGNGGEDKPTRRETELKKHDSGSRRHRHKTGRAPINFGASDNDSAAFQKRLREFMSNVKASKKEIKDVSKAIRHSRRKEKKGD